MSRTYLQHPFLKNPVKWIRGVNKRHISELYLDGYYNIQTLSQNPFVKSLSDTRLDTSKRRFPIGNMIQVVVGKISDQNSYCLTPVLQKPIEGQNPASFIINNKEYIKFLGRKRFFPIPSKYRHKSSSVIGAIKAPKDFSSDIETLYRKRISELIEELHESKRDKMQENNYVLLKPSDTERIQWETDSPLIIYTTLIQKETFVSYNKNPEILSLLIKLSIFVNV